MLEGGEQGSGNAPAKEEEPDYVVEGEPDSEQHHGLRIVQHTSKNLEKPDCHAWQQPKAQQAYRPFQEVHDPVNDPSHTPIITGLMRGMIWG